MPQKIAVMIAAASLVVLLIAYQLTFRQARPQDTSPLFFGIGEVLAQETASALNDRGRIILVAPFDYSRRDSPADNRWTGFSKELKKHPAISLDATEVVRLDFSDGSVGCAVPTLKSILERHAGSDAIVFITQLPYWDLAKETLSQSKTPKIIALDSVGMTDIRHYKGYLANGMATALIVPCMVSSANAVDPPKTSRQWFDKYYKVFTPKNYQELPD